MHHLLKFTYDTEDSETDVFLVLNNEQHQKFIDYGGREKSFTYRFPVGHGSDLADIENNCRLIDSQPLCDDNDKLHQLLSDKRLGKIIHQWLEEEVYYRVTFKKIYLHMREPCTSCIVPHDKYPRKLNIVLTRSEIFKLKFVGKVKNFSFPNNHTMCDRNSDIFVVWRFAKAKEIDKTRNHNGDLPCIIPGHPGLTEVVKLALNE
jgi:hypothetical protein